MSETATGAEATGTAAAGDNSFVVVANRLPVDMITESDGTKTWQASPGGLVSALSPVLEKHQGCWVGWPGVADESPEPFRTDRGVLLHPVELTQYDYEEFYEGFSNATLWPLYHNLIVTRSSTVPGGMPTATSTYVSQRKWHPWQPKAQPCGCRTISCSLCQNSAPIAPRSHYRLLLAYSVPTARNLPPASLA